MRNLVNLSRSLLQGEILHNAELARLYLWVLYHADDNGVLEINLRPFAQEFGVSVRSLRTLIRKLIGTQLVTHKTTHKTTRITLCQSLKKAKQVTHKTTHKTTQNSAALMPDFVTPSWVDPEFTEVWDEWIRYRKETHKTYKSDRSAQQGYRRLKELSGNNPDRAMAIVRQSIANCYQGMFPLKQPQDEYNRTTKSSFTSQRKQSVANMAQAALARLYGTENGVGSTGHKS